VAGKYLTSDQSHGRRLFPTDKIVRATIPDTPNVAALVKDYKGGKALAKGEDFDPTPENLDKRTKRFTLPSGVKVALLSKKTRGEAVTGQLVLRFGNEKSLADFKDATDYLGSMMMRGTKNRTQEQINDDLDKLASSCTPAAGWAR